VKVLVVKVLFLTLEKKRQLLRGGELKFGAATARRQVPLASRSPPYGAAGVMPSQ
jgi:hypothetical protein